MVQALCKNKKINCVEIDGADAKNEELRSTLLDIASLFLQSTAYCVERNNGRQEYPAYFALHPDRSIVFLGHVQEVQKLIDEEDVSPEVLAHHPELPTFSRCFKWSTQNCQFF